MNKKPSVKNMMISLIAVAVLVLFDQFTKLLAVNHLMNNDPFVIWKNVFELRYLENRGAAFGMLQNKLTFFILITVVILALVVYFYLSTPVTKKYLPLRFCMVLITAGAIGNCIDRVFRGFVVDFFYFRLIDFPIFNVADIYVTVAFILLAVLVLFYYKDEDFAVYSRKKTKSETK